MSIQAAPSRELGCPALEGTESRELSSSLVPGGDFEPSRRFCPASHGLSLHLGYIDLYGFSFLRTTWPSPPAVSSIGPTLDEVTSVGCPQSGSDLQKGEVSLSSGTGRDGNHSKLYPSQ